MSSHHIVRDAQEPALIIADELISFEIIGQLLEWSPVVVVLEHYLPKVLSWGIKIDIVICFHAHYETVVDICQHQQPIQIFSLDTNYEEDLVHFAIAKLIARSHNAISIVWELFNPQKFMKYIDDTELITYQNDRKGYFVKQGVFKKWITANTQFYLSEDEHIRKVENLERLEQAHYQVKQTGLVSFKTEKLIFIKESF
jgi:thiamine pyrophosphokinase